MSKNVTVARGMAQPSLMQTLAEIEPGSRREARARRIVDAAIELFKEHGFHKTSVRMIADAADVSMGNLYQYIHQKEDLVYLAAAIPTADFYAHLSSLPADGTVRQRIETLFQELVSVIDRHREELQMLQREVANLPTPMRSEVAEMARWAIGLFEGLIDEGIAQGEIELCDPHLLATSIHALAHAWNRYMEHLTRYKLTTFRQEQTRNVLRMIPFKSPVGA